MRPCTHFLVGALLITALAQTVSAQVPDLMYFRFNSGAGTSAVDSAIPGGISVSPSLSGLATWNTTTPRLGAAALELPVAAAAGQNCKTGAAFSVVGSWTIEFWYFGLDTSTSTRYLFGDSSSTTPLRLYKTGAANMFFGATGFTGFTLTNAYTPNVWTHIALVYDGVAGNMTVYKDGAFLQQNSQPLNATLNVTSASGLSIGGASTTTQFQGSIDEFRFWKNTRSAAQISSSMNIELFSFSDDLALESINGADSSVGCSPLSAAEPIGITIRNVGSNSIPAGTVIFGSLTIDGGSPIVEAFLTANTLNTNDSASFSFTATANLAALGSHTVDVSVAYTGDLNSLNDSVQKIADSGGMGMVSSFPWLENFDGSAAQNSVIPPFGWTQDSADATGTDSDWYMHYGQTASVNTGPLGDHTTGGTAIGNFYAYVEDSTGNFAQVNLLTPCLDMTSLISPIAQFWLHSFNGNPGGVSVGQNDMSVDVISYPGGIVTMDVFGPQGHLPGQAATWAGGHSWQQQTINLAPFAGQTIQLRFRGRSNSSIQYHDQAIDDVAVFEPVATPGQAPQAGQAVFDINNNAINANTVSVSNGAGGPYFSDVYQGSNFDLHFEGEPFQPIVVVYGVLNPVSATYPNGIGQFDIGGPGVDMNGIPNNIAVFANAIGWVQAGAPGFPFDALFFTKTSGMLDIELFMPPFGLPAGTTLTTFQAAVATNASPFVRISNAIKVTLQ